MAGGTVISNTATLTSSTLDPATANNTSTATSTVNASADLSLVIDGSEPSLGSPVTYTLTVFNIGPSDAQAVTVSDALSTPLPFNAGTVEYSLNNGSSWNTWTGSLNTGALAVRASRIVLLRGTVSGSYSGTTLSNTGTVSSTTADPDNTNNTYTTVAPLVLAADLSIVKTCNTPTVVAGQAIEYQLAITNAGPGQASLVSVTDYIDNAYVSTPEYSLDNGSTWIAWTNSLNIGTMSSGSTTYVLLRGTVLSSVKTSFENIASVTSPTADPNLANNSSTYTTVVTTNAQLFLTKECNTNPVIAGERIQYTITVSNPGPSDAQTVTITDDVPALISDVEYSLNNGSSWITWAGSYNLGALPATNSVAMLIRGTVNSDVAPGTLISNTATASSTTGRSGAPGASGSSRLKSTNTGDISATANSRVSTRADLMITDVSTPDPVIAGQNVTYTIKVTNMGPSDATDVSISNSLPAGLTLVSSSATAGTWANPNWTVGTLVAGQTTTLILVGSVNVNTPDGTVLVNTSRINTTTYDPMFSNNLASETTRVYSSSDLSITVSGTPDPVIAGNQITYLITVNNSGPSDAKGVQVTDQVPSTVLNPQWSTNGGTSWNTWASTYNYGLLPSGSNFSFLIRGTVDPTLTPSSVLSNTASVISTTFDPDGINSKATFTSVIGVCQTPPVVGTITQPTCAVATGSVVLTGLPAGNWTINPGAVKGSTSSVTITGLAASATYNFTVTNASGCVSLSSDNVVINGQPTAPAAPVANNLTVPYNGLAHTASATVASGETVDWYTLATGGSITTAPSATAVGIYTAWAQARNTTTGCVSATRTQVTLTINATVPVISSSATAGSTYGTGSTYQIIASNNPSSFNATVLPTGMTINTNTGLITVGPRTAAGTHTITLSATNATGTGYLTLVYTIGQYRVTALINANSKCYDGTPAATVNSWIVSGVLDSDPVTLTIGAVNFADETVGNGKTVTASGLTLGGAAAGNYVLTSTTATGNANIYAQPGTPTVVLTQPTCDVSTGTIEVVSPVGSDLTYSVNGTDYQSSTVFNGLANGSYYVYVKNQTGCTSVSAVQNVNSQPIRPVAPTVLITQPTCDVVTGNITVTAPLGSDLTYSINGVAYQSSPIFTGVPAGTVYQVTVKSGGGCLSPVTTALINDYVGTPAAPTLTTVLPTCDQPYGAIVVSSPIGAGLLYSINGIDFQTSNWFNGLEPGTYQVTVKTTTGCQAPSKEIILSPMTPVLVANDDIGELLNGYYGGTSLVDVLSNDLSTCGPASLDNVTVTLITSTHPKVRLSGTSIIVDPETPSGFYVVVYRICAKNNPSFCKEASVTVPVQNSGPALMMDAFDDAGKVLGTTGGIAVRDVLANDKLGSAFVDPAKVNVTFISSTSSKVTLDGAAVVVAENTAAGTYTLVYKVCEKLNPTNCDQATVTVTVESSSGVDPVELTNFNLNLSNYPNPFRHETTITFDLPEAGEVILKVYDMTGKVVGQIDQTDFNQGSNTVGWKNYDSQQGMYILRMIYKGRTAAKTISIIN